MDIDKILLLAEQLSNSAIIQIDHIPEIDLYMDQVLTFLNERLTNYKRNNDEKLLTKTMINNYTKDNILPPPVKKKYSKKNIILLILVYHMKSALSINDIDTVLKASKTEDTTNVENLYQSFIGLQKSEYDSFADDIEEVIKKINILNPASETELKILTIFSLILEANAKKLLAEKLIDELRTQ